MNYLLLKLLTLLISKWFDYTWELGGYLINSLNVLLVALPTTTSLLAMPEATRAGQNQVTYREDASLLEVLLSPQPLVCTPVDDCHGQLFHHLSSYAFAGHFPA